MRKKYVFNLTNLFFQTSPEKIVYFYYNFSKKRCNQENLLFYPIYCWTFYIEICSQCKILNIR